MKASLINTDKANKSHRKKVLWVSFLILDVHLHKTTQLEVLKNLAKRGYDASLIAMRSKSKFVTQDSQVNIMSFPLRYVPVLSPILFSVALIFFLPFYIAVEKPDYIITDPDISIFGFVLALAFSKLTGTKVVLDIRSTQVEIVGSRGFLRTFFFSTSVLIAKEFFDGITTITLPMKREICDRYQINPRMVGVWSSGVSVTLFNPETYKSEVAEIRKRLGIDGKFVVLYHGVFSANRGLIETIEAMSMIKRDTCKVTLFLLGTGPLASSLKDIIQDKKLQDCIIIHDSIDYTQVPKYVN